jgi:hypothetical protein
MEKKKNRNSNSHVTSQHPLVSPAPRRPAPPLPSVRLPPVAAVVRAVDRSARMHTGLAATSCARHVSTSSALPSFASHTARLGIRSLSSLASSSPPLRASATSSPSPGLLHRSRPRLTRRPTAIQSVRYDSWTARLQRKASQAFSRKGGAPPSESQEEAAKDAILDKLMKGRQPTDLMLRCTYVVLHYSAFSYKHR